MTRTIVELTALLAVFFGGLLSCDKMPQELKIPERPEKTPGKYIYVQSRELLMPDKSRFEMKGVNLAGWLSPNGHLFGLDATVSEHDLSTLLFQIAGPAATASFWSGIKDNFITKSDIDYLSGCGANTVRVPFDWRLFSDKDFMGLSSSQDGFEHLDKLFSWCSDAGIYVILSMQSTPGGQSGDETDNGFGYPFLMESKTAQTKYADVWGLIAEHFKNEKQLLGYELMTSPIYDCPEFDALAANVEALSRKAAKSIRTADANHIIILDAIHSGQDFSCYSDFEFDDNILYAGAASSTSILSGFLHFREYSTGLPVLVTEVKAPSEQEAAEIKDQLDKNCFGYAFSPYKSCNGKSSIVSIGTVPGWSKIKALSEAPRSTYEEIHSLKYNVGEISSAMREFINACKLENCTRNKAFTDAAGFSGGSK